MRNLRKIRSNLMGADEHEVQDVPRVAVYRSVVQSIPNAVATSTIWNFLEYDTDGMWSPTLFPERITCRTAGLYLFNATVGYSSGSAAGYRYAYFTKNATIRYYAQTLLYDRDAVSVNWNISAQIFLSAGDYVTVDNIQNSGGALNSAASSATNRQQCLQACLISTI